jgi:hypothetical protein
MAYRPRRTRKPCRRSTDGHHASHKPNRCPDNGCISFADSCQDKLGGVERGQLDLSTQGGNIGLCEHQFARPLPLLAHLPIRGKPQHVGTSIQDGAQRAAIFSRQWSGQLGLEIRGGHGRKDRAAAIKRESKWNRTESLRI